VVVIVVVVVVVVVVVAVTAPMGVPLTGALTAR